MRHVWTVGINTGQRFLAKTCGRVVWPTAARLRQKERYVRLIGLLLLLDSGGVVWVYCSTSRELATYKAETTNVQRVKRVILQWSREWVLCIVMIAVCVVILKRDLLDHISYICIDAAYCCTSYTLCCLCVGHTGQLRKNSWTDQNNMWGQTRKTQAILVLDWAHNLPLGRGTLERSTPWDFPTVVNWHCTDNAAIQLQLLLQQTSTSRCCLSPPSCYYCRYWAVCCARYMCVTVCWTHRWAVQMWLHWSGCHFQKQTCVGPRNIVLDGSPDPPQEGTFLVNICQPIVKYEAHLCVAVMLLFAELLCCWGAMQFTVRWQLVSWSTVEQTNL